jgi:hypothetical protein
LDGHEFNDGSCISALIDSVACATGTTASLATIPSGAPVSSVPTRSTVIFTVSTIASVSAAASSAAVASGASSASTNAGDRTFENFSVCVQEENSK